MADETNLEGSDDHTLHTHGDHEGVDEDVTQEQHGPVSGASTMGEAVLAIAESMLALREDAGTNQDSAGLIRTFFLEGLRWPAEMWDNWAEKYPKSGVAKPEWCAAFAGFCVRKAHEQLGQEVPVKLAGTDKDTQANFTRASRFIARADLFDESGAVRPDARRPSPGDLVVWKNHVGLLKELRDDGTFLTVEGNTWQGAVRNDGVYQLTRKSTEKRKDNGEHKLHGFCIISSVD
jgi:hypothetical protein